MCRVGAVGPRWVTMRVPSTLLYQHHRGDPLPEVTACPPPVVADTISRTIELGMTITDAAVDAVLTTIFCVPVVADPRCPDYLRDGRYRGTVVRALTDLPVAGYPPVLRVSVHHSEVRADGFQPGGCTRGPHRTPVSSICPSIRAYCARHSCATVTDWLAARTPELRDAIDYVAIEPSASCAAAIRAALPHAKILVDHFDLAKRANDTVTRVAQSCSSESHNLPFQRAALVMTMPSPSAVVPMGSQPIEGRTSSSRTRRSSRSIASSKYITSPG